MKKAWERELEKYENSRPVNFDDDPSDWSGIDRVLQARRAQLRMFWDSRVPGSRAPESLYTAMIQAWFNRGYDVTGAEILLDEALDAYGKKENSRLETISGRILMALNSAPIDESHSTHRTLRPDTWDETSKLMPAAENKAAGEVPGAADIPGFREKVTRGWQGQIAGGSYGTALEGYTGCTLRETWGDKLNGYIKEPETLNDDITFELAFLKAAERAIERTAGGKDSGGNALCADDIADMWLKYIPFGWSAEHFALENLRRGWYPPDSGRRGNYFSEWIGAQMRTMGCGYLAPGDPMRAARYAWMDSSVSHETNGIYAGIHSAVLSSLAFTHTDTRDLLLESRRYVPDDTEFAGFMDAAMESVKVHDNHIPSWEAQRESLKTYNWIHAYPNMVAVVHALWFCNNDIGRAFRILADCGADVDCNAGEVGSVLGIMFPIPSEWTHPFGDNLETYVPGMEKIKISALADWTADMALCMTEID